MTHILKYRKIDNSITQTLPRMSNCYWDLLKWGHSDRYEVFVPLYQLRYEIFRIY